MIEESLIRSLRTRYENAISGEKVVAIHLFAIENASDLDGQNLARIAESATTRKSYGAELRKGINLAPYVAIKTD